ncbi:hypothetical protein MACH07_22660 [Flagellimonas marinaquae]|uniref:Uncharacterized protein n=1 Tax=Flagellimonas marinaquae TaxID=254955 RepID=A0AA48HPR6_9FLAO|nr:hypothetical protein MACH07_22660 [Allomuricauda aquimarina]
MKTKLISRVSYADIFKGNESISELIVKSDVLKSLELLAIINKYQYKIHEKPNSEIQFILTEWLINEKQELKKQILDCFIKLSEKKKDKGIPNVDFSSVSIINRTSTLRLLEIFSSLDTNQKNPNTKQNSLILFKLYLLVNTEISSRQDKIFKKLFSKKASFMDDIKFHVFFGLTHPLQKSNTAKLIVPEVLKFIQFEKWIRKHEHYYGMTQDYIKTIGLSNWYEYFNDVFSLNNIATRNHKVSIKDYPVLKHVLNFFSSDGDFLSQWSEFINLKKRPIIRLNKESYLILDFDFLLNKFFSGLYHDILKFSKAYFGNKFSQDYNNLFVEEILLVNSIQSVFGKSYIKLSEREIKKSKIRGIDNLGIPDYYIRNGNKVFLFECKNSFISNSNKIDLDTDRLLEEIRNKFYFDSSKGKNRTKNKAVKQLLSYIVNSSQNKFTFFDKTKKSSNLIYYPIIVVTDYTLCSIGFNQLLNEYMKIEIQKLRDIEKRIKPLTIIHIDNLLYYQTNLKKIDGIILKYHSYLNNKEGFDSMISFSDYLDSELFKGRAPLLKKNVDHILKDSLLPKE